MAHDGAGDSHVTAGTVCVGWCPRPKLATERRIRMTETNETIITNLPADVAPQPNLEEELATSTRLLKEAQKHGNNRLIEMPDGTKKTVGVVSAEVQKWSEECHLSNLESKREIEASRARSAAPYYVDGKREWRPLDTEQEKPVFASPEEVSKFLGLKTYADLSPEKRAKARSIRPSDVKAVNLTEIFGVNSNGRRANELCRENPTLYKLARARAVDEGIL